MAKHNNTGKTAELISRIYLRCLGYKILTYNYKTAFSEIDIIACKNDLLVAVEVKYRTKKEHLDFSISQKQQNKINMGLNAFIKYQQLQFTQHRLDCILISLKPLFFQHIKNAW